MVSGFAAGGEYCGGYELPSVDEAGRNDIDAIAFTLLPRVVATSDVVKPLGRN